MSCMFVPYITPMQSLITVMAARNTPKRNIPKIPPATKVITIPLRVGVFTSVGTCFIEVV